MCDFNDELPDDLVDELKPLLVDIQEGIDVRYRNKPYRIKMVAMKTWNPEYNQDALCECGHPYYRHFDSYDDNYPVGCKYCSCYYFSPKRDE